MTKIRTVEEVGGGTDRQKDRQRDRQTDIPPVQVQIQADQSKRGTVRWLNGQIYRQIKKWIDRGRLRQKAIDRQKQMGRQSVLERCRDRQEREGATNRSGIRGTETNEVKPLLITRWVRGGLRWTKARLGGWRENRDWNALVSSLSFPLFLPSPDFC